MKYRKDALNIRKKIVSNKKTLIIKYMEFLTSSRPSHEATQPNNIAIQTCVESITIQDTSSDGYHKTLGY
jgi:hypothetical protein